jgi:2-polyprenyl-3-methyl-5-hydroxy-6-metoxy-1,4-benzoquinol methylase
MEKSALKQRIKKAEVSEKYAVIRNICRGRKVLDVGCIGQDVTAETENWLHNEIKEVASDVTGVDISIEKIAAFNQLGYHMLNPSQLERENETYDVVIMADVIEHVNDPVVFLKSYAKYLNDSGKMVITTPNANRAVNFFSIFFFNNYSVNDEHTCWFCPKTLNEVVARSGLNIMEFYWLKKYYTYNEISFASKVVTGLADTMAAWRKSYHQNFMIVVSK